MPMNWVLDLVAAGPLAVGLALVIIGHDKLKGVVVSVRRSQAESATKRIYDWLYVGYWLVVLLLLIIGTSIWFYTHRSKPDAPLIRGLFSEIQQGIAIATEGGRLYSSRTPSTSFGKDHVYWIFSPIDGDNLPAHTTFTFREDKKIADDGAAMQDHEYKEVVVYCRVQFSEVGMNSLEHREIRYHPDRKHLRIPDKNDHTISCHDSFIYGHTTFGTPITPIDVVDVGWFSRAAFATNGRNLEEIRAALNSDDLEVRQRARTFLQETYSDDSSILLNLLVEPNLSYRERLGSIWALSRVVDMPREDMFRSDDFPADVWDVVLGAAIDEDGATRGAALRFVVSYPNATTVRRLEQFGNSLNSAVEREKHDRLVADYHYYRGVSVLLANRYGWDGPDINEALLEMQTAENRFRTLKQDGSAGTDEQDYAKTLFGVGWATAVAAEYGNDESLTEEVAVAQFREFLSNQVVQSDTFLYRWQRRQAETYLDSRSVEAFSAY